MVTFEMFARAAVELLGGQEEIALTHAVRAAHTRDFHHGGADALPAGDAERRWRQVTPVTWRGSGDVPALTRANAFMVAESDRAKWRAGEWIRVLLK